MSSVNRTAIEYRQSSRLYQRIAKRGFDILFSAAVLIILSPVFAVLTVLILLDDGGPVIFKQQRSGKKDIPFGMYKFRSMKRKQQTVSEGEDSTSNVDNWTNGVPDDFVFKSASNDNPNVTKIGKFIRKYSLDELPQFLNVLKGEMSVVGPRPEIIKITSCYNSGQKQRLSVKPGITGWAQINGRSDMNHGEKIRHDLYYVNNFSLWLDMKIIMKTITQVFSGKGAV